MLCNNLKREAKRKLFHLTIGIIFSLLIYNELADWKHFLILSLFSAALMGYIKLTKKSVPLISRMIKSIGRESELPGAGAVAFLLGTFLAAFLFTKDIAAASIIILAIGDSVTPLSCEFFKKKKTFFLKHIKLKSFLLGLILCFISSLFFVSYRQAFFGPLVAMLIESWDATDFIDDNISMPVIAGLVMTLIS